jgi:hypothetical protein
MAGGTISGCTPATDVTLNWQIVNHTTDTLFVTTRYALDSVLLSPDAVKKWTQDSVVQWKQYPIGPLNRITNHGGRWYAIEPSWLGINTKMYSGPDNTEIRNARINPAQGSVIYPMPPGTTQILAAIIISGAGTVHDGDDIPPFIELKLGQGNIQRVLTQRSLQAHAFQQQTTGQENSNNAHQCLQISVEPGLLVEY